MERPMWREFLQAVAELLMSPTSKQKEAYCRWLHTLSAACIVGAVSIAFTKSPAQDFWTEMAKVVSLVFWAVILFIGGAILGKGE